MRSDGSRTATLALFALGSLAACSSGPVDRVPPVTETGQDDLADYQVEVGAGQDPLLAWVNGGDYLAVTTRGSSSCPRGPGSMTMAEHQHLAIEVVELRPDQEACSADDAPYVTIVEVPDGLDHNLPVTAVFDWGLEYLDDTSVTLAPPD